MTKIQSLKELIEIVQVIEFEIKQGYKDEAIKDMRYLIRKLKKGQLDKVCPNCNCLVELLK